MKKSLAAIAIVLLLIFVMGGVLAACTTTETIPADNSDVSEPQGDTSTPSASTVFSRAAAALPSGEAINFEWEAAANVGGSEYTVSLKGNTTSEDTRAVFAVAGDNVDIKIYLLGNGIYLDYDGTVYYLSDIDTDYLVQIIQKGLERLDQTITDLNILGMDLRGLVNLLLDTLSTGVTMQTSGSTTDYTVTFGTSGIRTLLDLVSGIIDFDSIQIGNIGLGTLLDNLFEAIGGGQVEVGISITDDVLSGVSAAVRNNGSDLVTLNTANMQITQSTVDYGIPEAVRNAADMSVTNLAFSAKLNVSGNSVDVGKLVNMFAGSELIPEGLVVLEANADVIADVALDLDLNYDGAAGDNNFAAVELYLGENRDKLLASLYYKDGALYIGALGDLASNENFKFVKVPVNGLPEFISSLVGTVTGAIDSALGTEWTHGGVVAVSLDGQGRASAAGNIYSVLSFVGGILGMDTDFASADGDTFSIDLNKALESVNDTFGTNIDISQYGNIALDIAFDGAKISSIGVDYSHTDLGIGANFTLDNILWGPQKQFDGRSISEYIDGKISSDGVIAAGDNLTEVILSAGIDLNVDLGAELTLAKGNYDIAQMLSGLGVQLPDGLGIDVDLDGDFVMPLNISLQASLRESGTAVYLEALAASDITLNGEVMFTQGTPVVSALAYNGAIYLDLSNITVAGIPLGKFKVDFDLDGQIASLLDSLLSNVDLEIDIPSLTGTRTAALAGADSAESGSSALTAGEAINVGIFSDKITASASIRAIIGLLNNFGINFTLDGLDGDISAEVKSGDYSALIQTANDYIAGFEGVSDNIAESVLALVNNKKISLQMNMSSPQSAQLALGEVITALTGANIPLNVNMGSFDTVINVDLAYNIDMSDMSQNKLMLEMKYGESGADNLILGAYIVDSKLYVDLTGLGFSKLCLPADTMLNSLMDLLGGLMDSDVAAGSGTVRLDSRTLVSGINANVTYDLAQAIFLALGIQLDFNIEAEGSIDISGDNGVSAVVNLGNDARVEANVSVAEMTDWSGVSDGVSDGYADISGEDSRQAIVDIIRALGLNLSIDITNHNTYSGGGDTFTRIKLETLTAERTVAGKTIGAGNLLVTVQLTDSSDVTTSGTGSNTDLIYVVIYTDGQSSGLRIMLNEGIAVIKASLIGINLTSIDLANYIDITVDLDLVGTLAQLIEGILVPAGDDTSSGTGEAVAALADDSAAGDSSSSGGILDGINIDVATLFKNIDVNLMPDKIGVDISFDAYTVNSLVDSLVRLLLGSDTQINVAEIDLGFGTGVVKDSYLAWVRYDRTSIDFQSDIQWTIAHDDGTSLYGFLGDIVRNEIGKMGIPILSVDQIWDMAVKDSTVSVGQNIGNWLYGLLAFPVWNEVTASANIVGGKIASIELYGVNNGQAVTNSEGAVLSADISYTNQGVTTEDSVTYDESTMSSLAGSYTRISIYNQSASVTDPDADGGWLTDWDNTPGRVVYNPYLYASAEEAAAELFAEFDTNQTVVAQNGTAYKRATGVTYTYEGSTFTRETLAQLLAAPGTYYVTATATFSDGSTLTRQIAVISRDIEGDYAIQSVSSDIYQGSLPTYIDAVYACGKTERLGADGIQFTYSADGMSITSMTFPGERKVECDIAVIPVVSVNGANEFNVSAFDIYRGLNGLDGVFEGTVEVEYEDGTRANLDADWNLEELLAKGSSQAGFAAENHEIILGNSTYRVNINVEGSASVRIYADENGGALNITGDSVLPDTVFVKTGTGYVEMPVVWADNRASGGAAVAVIGYDVNAYATNGAFEAVTGLEWMLLTFRFEV